MKINKLFLNIMLAAGAASLVACNGGNGSSNTNGMNELQEYVNQLSYSPKYSKQLSGISSNQQSFSLNNTAELANIQIAYYQESNCTSLNSYVTLNGPASMAAGNYTSTNASNYALCGRYPDGCVGLLTAVQNAPAWSMQYTYSFTNGTSYQSVCMNNPTNPVGKSAEFMANYSSGVAACTAGNSCGFSQAYSVLPLGWADQVGAVFGATYGRGISTDTSGYNYVTGYTDKGISGQTQTGTKDYFVAKYSESGLLLWTKQVGATSGTTVGNGISTDINGNSYVTGYTNTGISGQTKTGTYDYFIAKYDTAGNLIWTKQVGATSGITYGYGISTDINGNSYVTGWTNKGISGQTQVGANDYFIAKYDNTGNLIWTKQVGAASGNTYGYGISIDTNGNSYISGYTTKGISGQTQVGTNDYFIAKYDTTGNLIWTKQVGATSGITYGYGISTDINGNSYVTGWTNKGISGQTQVGANDYFIAKYDNTGNLIWTKQVGAASGNTYGYGISIDTNGNSYVTGYTDKGISGQTQTGILDYFIAKYDGSGNLIWTKQVGASGGYTYGYGISTDSNGNSYISGNTTKGISGQTQTGANDYFITKVPNQN